MIANRKPEIAPLVAKAQGGDLFAFHQLMTLFQGEIFRMIYFRTLSRMDSEDLTQEVFLRVYENLPKLKEAEKFRTWIFRIAINQLRDFLRRKRFRNFWGQAAEKEPENVKASSFEGSSGQEALLRKEFWGKVRNFTQSLSRVEREVFILRFMDQFQIDEIAEALGKNESTVKTHLYRALAKFKKKTELLTLLRARVS
jgi:RNA polymerase sigma-70 factor (ECF subfamily)